jgi:hypothetical protein
LSKGGYADGKGFPEVRDVDPPAHARAIIAGAGDPGALEGETSASRSI